MLCAACGTDNRDDRRFCRECGSPPGSVLVDDATRRATEAAIAFEDAGVFELKGKSEAVELWRAVRVVAARRGEGRARGLEPPFVGRERELSLLKQLLHATAEDGRAHLVSVSGIGGIAKSRLAAESTREMAAGRWAEAAEAAARWRASEESMSLHHPAVRAAYVNWAAASLRAGRPEAAHDFLERISSLPPGLQTPYFRAQVHRFTVLLGESDDAAAEMERAAVILRQLGFRYDLMMIIADAAESLPADDPGAERARLEALEIARDLGAVVVIKRLESSAAASAAASG
jgi:hypothetical protein